MDNTECIFIIRRIDNGYIIECRRNGKQITNVYCATVQDVSTRIAKTLRAISDEPEQLTLGF